MRGAYLPTEVVGMYAPFRAVGGLPGHDLDAMAFRATLQNVCEGGVKRPHSKALRAFSWFPGAGGWGAKIPLRTSQWGVYYLGVGT